MPSSLGERRSAALRSASILGVAVLLLAGTVTLERVRASRARTIRTALLGTFTRLLTLEQRVDTLLSIETAHATDTLPVPHVRAAHARAVAQVLTSVDGERAMARASATGAPDSLFTRNLAHLARLETILRADSTVGGAPAALSARLRRIDSLRLLANLIEADARGRSVSIALTRTGNADRVAWLSLGLSLGTLLVVGVVVLLTVREMRARLAAEHARDERDAQNALAFRVGRMGWWSLETATGQGRWSRELGPLFGQPEGWTPEPTAWIDLVHEDDRARTHAQAQHALAQGAGQVEPWRVVHANGEVRWLEAELLVERDAQGAEVRCHGITRDVTDAMVRMHAHEQAEMSLRTVLETMAEGVLVRRVEDMHATVANAAAARMLGVPDDELRLPYSRTSRWQLHDELGRPVPPDAAAGAQAIRRGETVVALYEIHRPDGTWVWTQATAVPFDLDAQGRARAVLLTFGDLSATRALEVRLSRLSLVAEHTEDGVLLLDAQGRVEWGNPAFSTMSGVSVADVRRRGVARALTILPDTDAGAIDAFRAALQQGERCAVDLHLSSAGGRTLWILATITPIRAANGTLERLVLVGRDISERKRLERERAVRGARIMQQALALEEQNTELLRRGQNLALAESRMRAVLEAMTEGVVLRAHDGRVVMGNPSAERILGLTTAQLMQDAPMPEGWTRVRADGTPMPDDEHPALVALATGAPIEGGLMGVRRGDGSLVWLQVSAVPLRAHGATVDGVVATFSDITALRQTEQALVAQEAHYKLMATGIRDVVSLTGADGRFEWVSPTVTSLLGWRPEDLVGVSALELLHPDDAATFDRASFLAMIAATGSHPPVRDRMRRADGEYVWTETTFTPRRDADGQTIGYLRVTRDVTDRRQIEARLNQAERLQAVGTLAGGLAHDFNNVLAVVRGTAEQLHLDTLDPRTRDDLETILLATDRARTLTRKMLTFARRQVRVPVVHTIDDVLRGNLPLLQHLVRSPEQIVLRCGARGAFVRVDADEFGTALMNLVSNARDAMPDGGTVAIYTDTTTHDADGDVIGLAAGRYVRVRVTDTGHGMPESVLERAFEPFFTTKAVGEGTGLGLATVHGVLKAIGGAVTIESREHVGTSVTLWLPQVAAMPTAIEEAPTTPGDGVAQRPLRVLVVDDEPALRSMLARLATRWGHSVVAVGSGEEALARLADADDAFDALITDFAMPGLTGRDLIDEVRRSNRPIATVLMSGYTDDPDTRAWLEAGGTPFLEKPFTLASLGAVLRSIEEIPA